MVESDAKTRGDLAEDMIPAAAALVGAVHEGGRKAVAKVLDVVGPERMAALAVVLAAMVDENQSVSNLLAWVTFDENGSAEKLPVEEQVAHNYGVILPIEGDVRTWDPVLLRACHAAHHRHKDLPWVAAGEREYQRRRKADRRKNSGPLTVVSKAWYT